MPVATIRTITWSSRGSSISTGSSTNGRPLACTTAAIARMNDYSIRRFIEAPGLSPRFESRDSGRLDFDEARVVRRRSARRRAIVRQHVGATALIHAPLVGGEPRALLDRHDAGRDPVGDADRQDRRAASIEDTDPLTVGEPALRRVGRMHPDVVAIGAGQDLLVAVNGVRPRTRLWRAQLERIARIGLERRDPGRDRWNAAEPVRVGLGGDGHRVDLDLARWCRERMMLRIPDLLSERDGIVGRG